VIVACVAVVILIVTELALAFAILLVLLLLLALVIQLLGARAREASGQYLSTGAEARPRAALAVSRLALVTVVLNQAGDGRRAQADLGNRRSPALGPLPAGRPVGVAIPVESSATVQLLFLNLVALEVFGCASSRKSNGRDAETSLESGMRRA